jgi:hypothetical protein
MKEKEKKSKEISDKQKILPTVNTFLIAGEIVSTCP